MTFTPAGQSEQQALYQSAFIQNCFHVLVRAHGRLKRAPLLTADEPDITGELIREAQSVLEADDAESWMERLEIKDDPPQNLPGKLGKKRPRIDFEFVQVVRGRRPRFHIEAKRLYRSDSVSEYFGSGGLAMFIEGLYAADRQVAGMLGYVQSDDCEAWWIRLENGLKARSTSLRVCASGWQSAGWSGGGLDDVKSTSHGRSREELGPIKIHHLLMAFC